MKINPDKIYLIKGMSPFNNSNIASCRDEIRIGYKGFGDERIPESLFEDVINRKLNISEPKSPDDFVNLLKLCVKYSQYVEFEEVNETKLLNN
jgi:hypothetical protein